MNQHTVKPSAVKPLVDELAARLTPPPAPAPVLTKKTQPAELDQDPGGRYSNNHVYPQT